MLSKKKIVFLHGMVTGTFIANRTYGQDVQAMELENQLIAAYPKGVRYFFRSYAEVLTYTTELKFEWHEDVPASWRALEEFWGMIAKGLPLTESFDFYSGHVSNAVLMGDTKKAATKHKLVAWADAMEDAHKVWVPKEWLLESELSPEDKADPS